VRFKEKFRRLAPGEDVYVYGFCDLTGLLHLKYAGHPFGISICRRLDDEIVDEIGRRGPTGIYLEHYRRVNEELERVCDLLAERLSAEGCRCLVVRPTAEDSELDAAYYNTLDFGFSHKMAATRAGLGWIGKTDLFISERFGPRIRLATVLIDKRPPLDSPPVEESRCGACSACVSACPAGAAGGGLWKAGVRREEFFDAFKCREKCRELSRKNIGADISLCGICVSVCPVGRGKKPRGVYSSCASEGRGIASRENARQETAE